MECVVYPPRLIYATLSCPVFPRFSLPFAIIMVPHRLLAWPKQASSEARNIVLSVLKSHEPISTRELFNLAVKVPAPPGHNKGPLGPWARYLKNSNTAPSHPDHPVRSIRCVFHATLVAVDMHTTRAAT